MIKIGLTDFTPVNKIIDIRDKNQVIKAKYAIDKNDVWKYTLMQEHYIEISFFLNRNVSFKRSDYIEWEGEKFTLRNDYQPEQINKRKYKYALKFEAIEMFLQDIQYYYLNQGLKESEWSLTGNPEYFLKIAVDNINRYFKTTEYKLGTVEPSEIKFITFELNTNVFDALTQIADEYGAEWYMEGKTIHLLNKVAFGDEVDFETEVSVLSMQRQEGESGTRYTRIVPLGSTRNIPKDYRETAPGEGVDAIYPKRLRIPTSKGDVIDAYPNMSPDEVVEGTVIFDEVYPKRIGTIQNVGTIEYTQTDEDTGTQTKWNAYKMKDSGINFKEEYLLSGEELRLQFVSGDLNGMDFALIFHKEGFSNADNSQYFEIVRNDDYGKLLPNNILKPKAGDQYVLYGFNIALVSDQYVPAGELELYDTAKEWMQNQLKDTSVYECETVIKHFFDNQMDLAIGQKVRLVFDDEKASTRSSRIMGFEKKLNNKFDAIYTVGDNSTYSRLANIEKEIKELQVAGVVYEATGRNGVYIIKQFDSTRPTDSNVYSAKASDAKYFNKQTGGTVQGDTTFAKNMQVQGTAIGDVFQNSTFTAGQLGSGFQIKRDANGQSYIEVDHILVRREAVFNRLTIAEIKSVGGTILLSLANMLVSKVEDKTSTWKCFFDTADGTIPNDFAVGDQAICRKFTGKNIKYYWVLVTAVGADYIELSKTDKDGSGIPAVGDEVVQLGNRTDINRQYAIMLSAYGSAAPSINQYAGINYYDLTGKEVTTISPKGNRFKGSFIVSTNGTDAPIYKERAAFVNGTVYYLNDRVSFLGSYWVCIVNTTVTSPSEGSSTWRKDTVGQKDIDNTVNNIQIGGRNYMGMLPTNYRPRELLCEFINNYHVKFGNTTIGGTFTPFVFFKNVYLKEPGTYTLSFYAKKNNEENFSLNAGLRSSGSPDFYVALSNDWQLITKKVEIISVSSVDLILYSSSFKFLKYSIEVKDIKLEKGNKATDWSPAPEDTQAEIDAAQTAANNAQTDATAANSLLSDIANDNKLTPNEKQETKKEWDSIISEYSKNITQANKFGISVVAYTNAYNTLNSYITPLLSNLSTTSNIVGTTFRTSFKNYYDARLDLLNSISIKAKELADNAQTTANDAQKEAEKVRSEYQADFVVLDTKIASKVSQTDFNALGNRVSETESSIIQQAGQITSVVEKVDNIKIGSRNLLPNTNQGRSTWNSNIQNGSYAYSEVEALGVRACKFTTSVASTGWHVLTKTINRSLIKNNTQYTLSLDVYSEFATSAFFGLMTVSAQNELANFGSKVIPADTWTHIELTATTNSNAETNQVLYITGFNKLGSVTFANLKLEEGNKATSWTPAPEDVQTEIDNAQNTANSKNRTYYQDDEPAIPSGGHKVGDLWYMNSLVDINGNINADSSKNKYQLQRRWNGSDWVRINWSASTSVIEQTDSNINILVEKTGINSIGAGSSLFSMIQLVPDQIKLEVSKVQIGGVNLVTNSQGIQKVGGSGSAANKSYRFTDLYAYLEAGKQYTFSCKTDGIWGGSVGVDTVEAHLMKDKSTIGGFVSTPSNPHTFIAPQTGNFYIRIDANKGDVEHSFWEFQVEEGNKPTPWKLSEGDRQAQIDKAQNTADSKTTLDEVSSSLTLVDNKITLASKTIELKGTTIAKAIEAEDLKVGSRSGLSTLEVLKDGTFYAKGSDSSNSSLIIDSKNRSIEIKSPKSTSHDGSSISGSSNVTISSESGGVRVDGSTIVSSKSAAIVSNSGIFANTAGQYVASTLSNISESRASIVGLGWGNVTIEAKYGKDNFVAGVYGSASNSGNAPAYGGYFDVLRANGLYLRVRRISSTTWLEYTDCYVSCYNMTVITVYLPSSPYIGQVIYLRQMQSKGFTIDGRGIKIHTDGKESDSVGNRAGRGDTTMLVYDGGLWCLNYMPR